MRERPILFSAPMVRAILAGAKTQTRRIMKPQPTRVDGGVPFGDGPKWARAAPGSAVISCPHGKRGDRLWVREAHYIIGEYREVFFRATQDSSTSPTLSWPGPWRPSIHMPRWASRITLEVTGVRVEHLHDISEADARAEGAPFELARQDSVRLGATASYRAGFQRLWGSINGPGSWDEDPWVWVIEFKRQPHENQTQTPAPPHPPHAQRQQPRGRRAGA